VKGRRQIHKHTARKPQKGGGKDREPCGRGKRSIERNNAQRVKCSMQEHEGMGRGLEGSKMVRTRCFSERKNKRERVRLRKPKTSSAIFQRGGRPAQNPRPRSAKEDGCIDDRSGRIRKKGSSRRRLKQGGYPAKRKTIKVKD